jgi:hypothetical protein
MVRKPATRPEFALFDVFYEDGSQRSNRRVPSEILGGLDGDAPARAAIEEQDRLVPKSKCVIGVLTVPLIGAQGSLVRILPGDPGCLSRWIGCSKKDSKIFV